MEKQLDSALYAILGVKRNGQVTGEITHLYGMILQGNKFKISKLVMMDVFGLVMTTMTNFSI
jgi:hypothetical protein